MLNDIDIRNAVGSTAYGSDGEKIGKVGQIFLDDQTNRPEFATVHTGLFGSNESFVPLADARLDGDRLTVPFTKDRVKDAPNVDVESGHIDQAEERRLYDYYGLSYSESFSDSGLPETGRHADTSDFAAGADTRSGTGIDSGVGTGTDSGISSGVDSGIDSGVGRETGTGWSSTAGTTGTSDDAMTRSEEHLTADTRSEEAGRARLRKYVVTEEETVTVPVRKERATLEREPITDANADDALSGPEISEDEHEVVLREERPVVGTEAEPVERVRLGTETTTEQETVSGEVRKEQIDVEGDVDDRR